MSQRTRVQLVSQIVTDLPDNEEGLISPEDVRNVLTNMLDSTYMPEDSAYIQAATSSLAYTASYIQASGVVGLNLARIATGSITASVNIQGNLFNITSEGGSVFSISDTYGLNNGFNNVSTGSYSHAEGVSTTAIGDFSHAEGYVTTAGGYVSHAEGFYTYAEGDYSHVEGAYNRTIGLYSHAEGAYTTSSGEVSHAEGVETSTVGYASHAEGLGTIASGSYQHVQGKYNIPNTSSLMIIGNGVSESRSNLVLFNQNDVEFSSSVYISGSLKIGLSSIHNSVSYVTTVSGSNIILDVPVFYYPSTILYTSFFCNYTLLDGLNARSGQISSAWNNYFSTIYHTETTTMDIGNTSGVSINVSLYDDPSTVYLRLTLSSPSNWIFKASYNLL